MRTPREIRSALTDARFAIIDSRPNGGPIDSIDDRFAPPFARRLRRRLEKMMEPGYFITIEAKAI